MARKIPIPRPDRVRRITGTFSWLDHRLMRYGHVEKLSRDEMALYLFLVLAGDRHGVSFYRMEKICRVLDEMEWAEFRRARDGLVRAGLIHFEPFGPHDPNGWYQVLSLEAQAP